MRGEEGASSPYPVAPIGNSPLRRALGRRYSSCISSQGKERFFNPHDSARAESLAGVKLADFRRRFVALLIDFLLVCIIYVPAAFAIQYVVREKLHIHEDLYSSAHIKARFEMDKLLEVIWTLWLILYFGISVWATNGFTFGKRLMRIRILSLTHEHVSFWQAIQRARGYGAWALEGGLGFVQFFLNHNRLCTHDRIAETIVVDDRTAVSRTNSKEAYTQ